MSIMEDSITTKLIKGDMDMSLEVKKFAEESGNEEVVKVIGDNNHLKTTTRLT